jgi:hypothetical protein
MQSLRSFAGLFGALIPLALLIYGVALLFGAAPNPNALWAQAEPWLRPLLQRIGAIRAEDGVMAFNEARNWVIWGASFIVILLTLWFVHKWWMAPIARTASALRSTAAEQMLKAHESKEQKLFALLQELLGTTQKPANLDAAVAEISSVIADGRAETKALALLDGTFASFGGRPTTSAMVRGALFTTVQTSAHASGLMTQKLRLTETALTDANTNLEQNQVALANSRTTIADLQATLASMLAKETEVLMAMRDLVKASKAGDSAKLAKAQAKAEALEAEIARLADLAKAAIGNRGGGQQPQPPRNPPPRTQRQPQQPGPQPQQGP